MGEKKVSWIMSTMLVAVFAAVFASDAAQYNRERYEVIVDRSPFGADPLAAAAKATNAKNAKDAAAAAAAAKAMEKELRLCFLLESETGEVRAGFQNLKAKPGDPKSVMLRVGENFRGMKLENIDLGNSSATLLSNGKSLKFELAKAVAAKAAPAAKPQPRRIGGGFRRQAEPKKEPEPKLSPEEEAKRREEVRENLRQYQMEVIRAGMPPLPIPLTEDMDSQLVAEGILPPGE
ncbi:hypothetical protein [Pontiella sulfatireligans]|uniref:Type II secretion system protein GspC N-terminal domain-containing protein n=1 Tax=Pontiella sulfatireligans TaxID=2750658 RepID=A0A6C2URE5_9BACT|nr:hypothetical protein [Pontiella sulfatireligans]VGO22875.1 hypothetical protein SCARR_04972 [Pontiella sulfatireligans]